MQLQYFDTHLINLSTQRINSTSESSFLKRGFEPTGKKSHHAAGYRPFSMFLPIQTPFSKLTSGVNPTIARCNASVVKIYSATM
jgi:hypothetical protein